MPSRQDISFEAFIVDAGFVGQAVAFALGDGTVRFIADGEERIVEAHKGAVLAACVTPDEVAYTHRIFTAALKSHAQSTTEVV